MIAEENFDGALRVGESNQSFTPRLTAMRAYALSRCNILGDSLFCYPLRAGSQDLLPVCPDTLIRGNVQSDIYEYLGARPASKFSEPHVTHFLELVYQHDTIPRPQVAQYLLCSYLLDKNLKPFEEGKEVKAGETFQFVIKISLAQLDSERPTHVACKIVCLVDGIEKEISVSFNASW